MPWPLIPVVIDEATEADAGEWRAALPYLRFPVSEYRAPAPAEDDDPDDHLGGKTEHGGSK